MSEYRLIYCSDRVTLRKVTQLHTDRWDGQDNCSKYECESVTSSVKIFTLLRSNDEFSFRLRRRHCSGPVAAPASSDSASSDWATGEGVESDTRHAL